MYNKVVMDHFKNPRNVCVIEDADGIGEDGNPICGDMMTINPETFPQYNVCWVLSCLDS